MVIGRGPRVGRAITVSVLAMAAALAVLAPVAALGEGPSDETCDMAGVWIDPRIGDRLPAEALFESMARKDFVLLGESHSDPEHHLWQLHTLAGLFAHRPRLVVGFEMFPRSAQPTLDDWADGGLNETAFLQASRWQEVWGYEPGLYMPLFHFVRQNRLPMVALNVERALVSRVGREGWAAVPPEEREGLSDPAPALDAYRESLAEVYLAKMQAGTMVERPHGADQEGEAEPNEALPDLSAILASADFARFVEAQLTWDRAMAEALAAAKAAHPDALVVGVVGRGHAEYGHGVPHQLADLTEGEVAVLLPQESGASCEALDQTVADAVFLVSSLEEREAPADKPRLGVVISESEDGVRITRVVEGSVAEAAELAVGDVVRSAAGVAVLRNAELIEIVQRQAPGTWLPLVIERGDSRLDIIAKFPAKSE